MKYIIDEEELLDLIDQYDYNEPNINDFLKSKTPVEEIVEGNVKGFHHNIDENFVEVSFFKGMKHIIKDEVLSIEKGKNIKIYIEVVK